MDKIIFLFFILIGVQIYSQQSIVSSGGTSSNINGNISITVGQVGYGFNKNAEPSISEGMQQVFNEQSANPIIENTTICAISGSTTNFTVISTADSPTYLWQFKTQNSDWKTITNINSGTVYTNFNSATLNIKRTSSLPVSGTLYRVLVTDSTHGTLISNDASIIVNPTSIAGSITGASGTICYDSGKTLTLSASHRGTVQWQSSSTIDGQYNDIIGATDKALNSVNLYSSTYFKAVVTNGVCPSSKTSPAKVTVYPQSTSGSILGGGANVCPEKNNTKLTLSGYIGKIQWQYSNDNVIFYNVTSYSISPTYTAKNLTSTTYYRAVVTNGTASCTPAISESVVINVNTPVAAGTISGNNSICYGTATSLNVSYYDIGASIQWQKASTLTGTYANVTTGIGFTTNNYITPSLTSSTYYRAKVTFNGCSSTTEPFLLTVQRAISGKITGGTLSSNTVCTGTPSVLTLTGYAGTNIQWLSSNTTTATSFTPISGANSDNYEASISAIGRIYYRASVSYSNCLPVLTPIVNLTVANCSISKRISTITNNFEAMAYPNPFSNSFLIEINTPNQELVKISVYDMLGRLIEQQHAKDNTMEIGANYQSGTYILKVSQGENQKTLQVIKK